MGDAESDIYELMVAPRAENVEIIVRATQARCVMIALTGQQQEPQRMLLPQALEHLDIVGHSSVTIQRENKNAQVQLELSIGRIDICAPTNYSAAYRNDRVSMSVVCARELSAEIAADEPIAWTLLYSGEVSSYERASQIVAEYALRWTVERFHYTLKSGLKIEKIQFDDKETICNAIAVYSVVAWQIMWLTYFGRKMPMQPLVS